MKFFVGLHQPADAGHFDRAFISVNRLSGRNRRTKPVAAREWIMDSGAFTEIATHGEYRRGVADYAVEINRWAYEGSGLVCAVAQDYMCEPFIIAKTGLCVAEHQIRTIKRYDDLKPLCPTVYIMPVLQGYTVDQYVVHLRLYGGRLAHGAYVGVGSVCKRNTDVTQVRAILQAIKQERPDLRLHGFGLKTTALDDPIVRSLLESADSMAWSFAARKQGRDPNDWREAAVFAARIG